MKKRDEADLKNEDLAIYQFRGYTVFKFNKKWKTLDFGDDANMCVFCNEDYDLMANFLLECKKFRLGEVDDIENVEVF